ncbi:amino acid ABC transporter permease [Candidatus Micrarchaeota archaeon]|nr:amino acid ABC transporter permease [Candidatus Micrarchaeota archaeon]
MSYTWNFGEIWKYKEVFLEGSVITMELTVLICFFGTLLGLGIALLERTNNRWIRIPLRLYIDVTRAVPVLVLLIWLYYCIPIFTGLGLDSFATALIALSINMSPFASEIIRSAIESIPKGQYESGQVLGFTKLQTMFRIILPQAVKQMIPNMVSLYITMLKFTSLASVIAVNELLHVGNTLISNTYRPLEVYTTVALVYIALVIPLTYLSKRLERGVSIGKVAV